MTWMFMVKKYLATKWKLLLLRNSIVDPCWHTQQKLNRIDKLYMVGFTNYLLRCFLNFGKINLNLFQRYQHLEGIWCPHEKRFMSTKKAPEVHNRRWTPWIIIATMDHGNIWKYLEISGNILKYLEISGNIWKYLKISGNIWKYLEIAVCLSYVWYIWICLSMATFQDNRHCSLWKPHLPHRCQLELDAKGLSPCAFAPKDLRGSRCWFSEAKMLAFQSHSHFFHFQD